MSPWKKHEKNIKKAIKKPLNLSVFMGHENPFFGGGGGAIA